MSEQRRTTRDSLFLIGDLQVDGFSGAQRIKIRNLSRTGMMGEAPLRLLPGAAVHVHIRNIGWVEGAVIWAGDGRFGIRFGAEIEPKLAREPVRDGEGTPRYVRPPLRPLGTGVAPRKL